jgi:hypothetical protein
VKMNSGDERPPRRAGPSCKISAPHSSIRSHFSSSRFFSFFIYFIFVLPSLPLAINKFSKNFILWVFSSSSSSIMIASRVIFHFVSFFCAPKKKSTN